MRRTLRLSIRPQGERAGTHCKVWLSDTGTYRQSRFGVLQQAASKIGERAGRRRLGEE